MAKLTQVQLDQTVVFLRHVRKLPPARQAQILEGMRDHGAAVRKLLRQAEAIIKRAERRGCSAPVIDDVVWLGQRPTVKGMKRSRGRTRIGDAAGTYPSRRLTPRNAVKMEDRYDRMTTEQADWCNDPPSVTGVQLYLLRMRKGTEKEQSGILSAAQKNARKGR